MTEFVHSHLLSLGHARERKSSIWVKISVSFSWRQLRLIGVSNKRLKQASGKTFVRIIRVYPHQLRFGFPVRPSQPTSR